MAACGLGGRNDRLGRGIGPEAGDVVAHGAGEKIRLLRKVADLGTERVTGQAGDVGAVEADMAGRDGPGAGEDAGKRGLAGGAGAEDAEHVAGDELEGEALEHGCLRAGRAGIGILDADGALDRRQWHRLGLGRHAAQRGFERGPAFAGGDDAAPLADDLFERADGAAHQDGGGDHRAGARLALDDEPGADAEDGGLEEEAERLGAGAEAGEDAARPGEGGIAAIEQATPAGADSAGHAEGFQHFGVAGHLGRAHRARSLIVLALLHQAGGHAFVERRGGDQHDRAEHGPGAEKRVEHEQHDEEERAERYIEHRAGDGARDEAAQGAQVADRPVGRAARIGEAERHGGRGGAVDQRTLEAGGGDAEEARARPFEDGKRAVEDEHEERQRKQGRDRLGGEDPVIDLQHVERAGQHQDVDEQAEAAGMPEDLPGGAQGLLQFGRLCLAGRVG